VDGTASMVFAHPISIFMASAAIISIHQSFCQNHYISGEHWIEALWSLPVHHFNTPHGMVCKFLYGNGREKRLWWMECFDVSDFFCERIYPGNRQALFQLNTKPSIYFSRIKSADRFHGVFFAGGMEFSG